MFYNYFSRLMYDKALKHANEFIGLAKTYSDIVEIKAM